MSTFTISAIKSELQQMVCKLHTAPTFQEALLLWQIENRQLTSEEIDAVMGVDPIEQAATEMKGLFDKADAIMAKPIYQD